MGVRKKRSIVVQKEPDEDAGKNRLKRMPEGAAKSSSMPPVKAAQHKAPVQEDTGGAQNGSSVQKNAIRKLKQTWRSRLCGVDVDRQADVFIAWSHHIQACDGQEVQEGNDESPR